MTHPWTGLTFEQYAAWARMQPSPPSEHHIAAMTTSDTILDDYELEECPPTVRSERGKTIITREKRSL